MRYKPDVSITTAYFNLSKKLILNELKDWLFLTFEESAFQVEAPENDRLRLNKSILVYGRRKFVELYFPEALLKREDI